LLGENAGLPLPGETILLLAGFLAYQHHQLQLQWIIVVGICAATMGDNIGYLIGYFGGRPLLEKWKHLFRISDDSIRVAEDFLHRRGSIAIFIARFIAGMRIVGGPLAGVLRMPWKKFVFANAAGAVVWVTTISLAGCLFGSKFESLVRLFKGVEIAILIVILLGWYLWRRQKKKVRQRQQQQQHQPATD
jgi:membrane protein DedA with SNARE-associated domain